MAKGSIGKSGTSKIRFIMLEADLSEGDLSQVTQAIQNALRPTPPAVRIISPAARQVISDDGDPAEENLTFEDEAALAELPKARAPRQSKPRVAKTPTVLDDIDVTSTPSLREFVDKFDISSNVDKYLVITLWFRDARAVNAVTVDHVYTCFRLLRWSTATTDFSKPLKNLREEQSVRGGAKEGYSLTLTGAGKIEAKKRSE